MTPKNLTSTLALLTLAIALPACDAPYDEFSDDMSDEIMRKGELDDEEALPFEPEPEPELELEPEPEAAASLTCDPDLLAAVGGLYYPANWDCTAAIADAESNLGSWHYRNACNQQVGSDLGTPVDDAVVASCQVDISGQILVTVDLCCSAPPFVCDPALQASVGGLHYPGWTCADATADAESNLNSWHYRNACNQQIGSDIAEPAADATVASCSINNAGSAVVEVDLCCAEPVFCDPALSASVGGLHYPGWTCAQATAHAESNLNSWHYRNACSQQAGSDINDPAGDASVLSCTIDNVGNAVVAVDLCCS